MNRPHPYAPEAAWRFAISRRFRVPRADEVYENVVRPVLEERGVVLECLFAANDAASRDFWMNRMKLILELADFHVFIRIGSSPQVDFEIQYSRDYVRWGWTPSLQSNFGLSRRPGGQRSPFVFLPTIITVSGDRGRDRYSNLRSRGTVHCPPTCGLDEFREHFADMIDLALEKRIARIRREERAGQFAARLFHTKPPIDIPAVIVHESALARAIASNQSSLESLKNESAPEKAGKVVAANEFEAWLHQIRRGETEFHENPVVTFQRMAEPRVAEVQSLIKNALEEVGSKDPSSSPDDAEVETLLRWSRRLIRLRAAWDSVQLHRKVRRARPTGAKPIIRDGSE